MRPPDELQSCAGSSAIGRSDNEVSLRQHDGAYRLSVADNGKGLRAGAERAGKTVLCMRLLKNLALQLGGTVEVDRTPPGVCFTIRFPIGPALSFD